MTGMKSPFIRLGKTVSAWKISWLAAFAVFLFLVAMPHSVQAGGFSLSVSPSSATTQPGSAAVYIITIKCNTCNVLVGASISPTVNNGPTLSLGSYHIINGGTPTLRVDAGPSTPLMTYTITVIVKDTQSDHIKSQSVTLTVNDFTVTANPTSITVPAGQTAASTITATGLNGFSGNITYSTPISPTTGLTCNLQPNPVTLSATVTSVNSTLSCSGTSGTYTVNISGTPDNGPTRTATVNITVN